jgi:hypothetical protein
MVGCRRALLHPIDCRLQLLSVGRRPGEGLVLISTPRRAYAMRVSQPNVAFVKSNLTSFRFSLAFGSAVNPHAV